MRHQTNDANILIRQDRISSFSSVSTNVTSDLSDFLHSLMAGEPALRDITMHWSFSRKQHHSLQKLAQRSPDMSTRNISWTARPTLIPGLSINAAEITSPV